MRFFDIFFQSAKFLHSLKNPKHFSNDLSFDGVVFFGAKKKPKKVLQNAKLGFFLDMIGRNLQKNARLCKKVIFLLNALIFVNKVFGLLR